MINPISSQSNIANLFAAQTPAKAAGAAAAPAPYSPMKEKVEAAGQETKESSAIKASETMHALASLESSQSLGTPSASIAVNTQSVTQAWSNRLWTGGS
jgi:hypothetical protein